jgi:hypothetical protein
VKRVASPDIKIVAASTLPAETQQPSQDLLLYSSRFTNAWLYLEQEHGARLIVLNVEEPSNIRLVGSFPTGLQKTYDLIPVPHKHCAILRFRDGSGQELLNLSNPRAPQLVAAPANLSVTVSPQQSGEYPGVELRAASGPGEGQDTQILETGPAPQLLATISHVTRQTFRPETGTLFLLGEHGLTVVRRLSTEQAWEASFVHDESQD